MIFLFLTLSFLSNPITDDNRSLDTFATNQLTISPFDPILNLQRELASWNVIQESLKGFLWRHFHVVMIEDDQCYSLTRIYRKSMERHVALFRFEHDNLDNIHREISLLRTASFSPPSLDTIIMEQDDYDKEGDYDHDYDSDYEESDYEDEEIKDGKRIQRIESLNQIKECSYFNLASNGNDEISDSHLDELAGSQASIKFKNIQYSWNGNYPSYSFIKPNGHFQLIVKLFKKNKKEDENESRMNIPSSKSSFINSNSNSHSHQSKQQKDKKSKREKRQGKLNGNQKGKWRKSHNRFIKNKRIFNKELLALETLYNVKNILGPICKDSKRLELMFPYLEVGDLIPLDSDNFVNLAIANPDETFLPRFSFILIQTIHDMHKAGVIHLDLKPENILIHGPDRLFYQHLWNSPFIQLYTPVLIDFGLSKIKNFDDMEACNSAKKNSNFHSKEKEKEKEKNLNANLNLNHNQNQNTEKKEFLGHIGTRCTMSPEQLSCQGNITESSDWWGLAASLWRIRIFWEPTLSEQERGRILSTKSIIGSRNIPVLEDKPFFSQDFREMLRTMAKLSQKDREFDKNINMLLNLDYIQRGKYSNQIKNEMK